MNWDDLRHFSALATTGSLSAAARTLGVEHATIARRIAALEATLGVSLADRRGRRWVLTPDGERIATLAERMAKEALAVQRTAEGARAEVTGLVTISAPPALALEFLAAPLVALHTKHPGLRIRIIGEARTASLDRGEADIAIRLSQPDKGALTIQKLGRMRFRLYASPAYLAATKAADWRFIGYDAPLGRAPQQAALETYAAGRPFAFLANSLESQLALARAGAGIAALPDFMTRADPGVTLVLNDKELLGRDIWLVVHSEVKRAAPVRAVIQIIQEIFHQPL